MAPPQITIIGLGLIGGSIGLALKASDVPLHIVGHDVDPDRNKLAQKMGAVDKGYPHLPDACQGANLVVIATPITAIRGTMAAIASHLGPDCVVTDTAALKKPVLAWAKETLPQGVPFVGGAPVLNPTLQADPLTIPHGLEAARADLFEKGHYALCPPATAIPSAVKRVTDMVNLIRARPLYIDPVEHDGMRAGVEGLATLVGLAVLQQASDSPGWREARKLASSIFGAVTAPLEENAEVQRDHALLNADYLLPRLDALIDKLRQLREAVDTQDAASMEKAFEQAALTRRHWLVDHAEGQWDQGPGREPAPTMLGSLGSRLTGTAARLFKEE